MGKYFTKNILYQNKQSVNGTFKGKLGNKNMIYLFLSLFPPLSLPHPTNKRKKGSQKRKKKLG